MLAWLETGQSMLATSAAALAIVATCWQLRLPSGVLVRGHGNSRAHRRARGHQPGHPGSWCSTRPWWSATPLGTLWLKAGAAFVTSGDMVMGGRQQRLDRPAKHNLLTCI